MLKRVKSSKKKGSQRKADKNTRDMTSNYGLTDRDFASNYGGSSYYDLDSNIKSRATQKPPNKGFVKQVKDSKRRYKSPYNQKTLRKELPDCAITVFRDEPGTRRAKRWDIGHRSPSPVSELASSYKDEKMVKSPRRRLPVK